MDDIGEDSDRDTSEDLDESMESLLALAEEESHEVLNLRKRRCTDIRTNPRVFLPKMRPQTEEAELLTRGSRILEVAKGFIDRECDKMGNQCDNNINKVEKEGMAMILKRIKNEVLVLMKTDKNHKLCAIGIETYRKTLR